MKSRIILLFQIKLQKNIFKFWALIESMCAGPQRHYRSRPLQSFTLHITSTETQLQLFKKKSKRCLEQHLAH